MWEERSLRNDHQEGINMEELKIREGARDPESKAYSLTQYTEHIHFQANEKGACLRGTEVKPKLDKFIDQYCEKNEVSIPKGCYLSQPGGEAAIVELFREHFTCAR